MIFAARTRRPLTGFGVPLRRGVRRIAIGYLIGIRSRYEARFRLDAHLSHSKNADEEKMIEYPRGVRARGSPIEHIGDGGIHELPDLKGLARLSSPPTRSTHIGQRGDLIEIDQEGMPILVRRVAIGIVLRLPFDPRGSSGEFRMDQVVLERLSDGEVRRRLSENGDEHDIDHVEHVEQKDA